MTLANLLGILFLIGLIILGGRYLGWRDVLQFVAVVGLALALLLLLIWADGVQLWV